MRKRESKYPWKNWTSTEAWRVQWNVDFVCLPESFRAQVHTEAAHREMKAATTIVTGRADGQPHDGVFVFFQFYKRDSLWKPNLEALPAVRELRK